LTEPAAKSVSAQYLERILRAEVYDVAIESPLDIAPRLSRRLGVDVFCKREDLQPVFSFKIRGAHNKLAQLSSERLSKGVICSSAGNHAQGVALAAQRRGIRAVVVMPENTATIKVEAVRALGGETLLYGQAYDEANEHALQIAAEQGLEFVHPFADPDVIAGQGTVAVELARQWREPPKAIFVPIGGGGLIAGIGAYMKQLHPEIKIIGVEPFEAASMHDSLRHGSPVTLEHVGIFADGVAVRRVSDETFRIAQEVVDAVVLVDTDEICAAIKDIFEDSRVVMEPAGALAIAGLKRYLENNGSDGGSYIAINSGANMNFDRLRHVTERAEIGEHREALIAVEIPEQRGAFLHFCETLGARNVTEFNYRYAASQKANLFVGVSLSGGRREAAEVMQSLRQSGYAVLDLSDNELAKLHVRYMVGGHVPGLSDEVICSFEFPERRGALLTFLKAVGGRWNISLFHYRNHGSDYGRVLAGVQVPQEERKQFKEHLDTLAYQYVFETDNPAYSLFLGSGSA
jgi:threonine dehydratase